MRKVLSMYLYVCEAIITVHVGHKNQPATSLFLIWFQAWSGFYYFQEFKILFLITYMCVRLEAMCTWVHGSCWAAVIVLHWESSSVSSVIKPPFQPISLCPLLKRQHLFLRLYMNRTVCMCVYTSLCTCLHTWVYLLVCIPKVLNFFFIIVHY